jgi:hypothetical protein
MRVSRVLLLVAALVLFGCGGSGGSDGGTKPEPPIEPPPIVCEEGYRLVDGECIPIPPPPPVVTLRVCLEWDAVVHPELVGYKVYYGKVSEQYDFNVEVAEPHSSVCVEDESYFVEGGSYYFVATALSDVEESDYSNEVLWEPQ